LIDLVSSLVIKLTSLTRRFLLKLLRSSSGRKESTGWL
jgi:hypothetical protein